VTRPECERDGCTNQGRGVDASGLRVCDGHLFGRCSRCQSLAVWRHPDDGQPVCQPCWYGPCEVDGCPRMAMTRHVGLKVCRPHRRYGLDYVAKAGHRAADPGDIYVVHHPVHGLVKIGIGKTGSGRLGQHLADGWVAVLADSLGTTRQARAIEKTVTDHWRASGVQVLRAAGVRHYGLRSAGRGHEVVVGNMDYARALARWVRLAMVLADPGLPPDYESYMT
jgi:hypothetical protein